MKYFLLLTLCLFMACKPNSENNSEKPQAEKSGVTATSYPETFQKILDAHGGLDTWDTYKTLAFTIPGEPVSETQTIDLHSRKDHIQRGTASLGFDGEQVWLHDPENSYKGNPEFYHNLMFYFYAMPFVLADPGIIYEKTEALVVSDTSYPGLKISFEENIGSSANDEYYLYYDTETYQMRWLGYTATFGAAEKGTGINYINYSDWMPVQDLILPKSISWYAVEEGKPTVPRNTVNFTEPSLSPEARAETFYSKNGQIESDL
ncbi:DUF6503 family protein [Leeuwenhoekiella sp. W20_SRS_FM14]|uniref:DUF6503 family protein n=1 Tax=Leeuwenhoekiella sp. W20_SRS_FM14 TaxID=3240270 RepID=UPI003F9BF701